MDLILASTSPYRRKLLERLDLNFDCVPPETSETPLPGEGPEPLARRLALEKAKAVASRFPASLVIGSDQVASLDGEIIGKPGNHPTACEQLRKCSGREVQFYTGVALVCEELNHADCRVETFGVEFRTLSARMIESYLEREQPYDCAGSFKCEGLGIALFTRLSGDDPTCLEGLPLIALTDMLASHGVDII